MDIESGNVDKLETNGTGWFIGYGDWIKVGSAGSVNLRFMQKKSLSHTVQAKWMKHHKGDQGLNKPPSNGRTIAILVSKSGRFRLQFAPNDQFLDADSEEHVLQSYGDFVIWGENIFHRWFVDEDSTILTFRWIPITPSNA